MAGNLVSSPKFLHEAVTRVKPVYLKQTKWSVIASGRNAEHVFDLTGEHINGGCSCKTSCDWLRKIDGHPAQTKQADTKLKFVRNHSSNSRKK